MFRSKPKRVESQFFISAPVLLPKAEADAILQRDTQKTQNNGRIRSCTTPASYPSNGADFMTINEEEEQPPPEAKRRSGIFQQYRNTVRLSRPLSTFFSKPDQPFSYTQETSTNTPLTKTPPTKTPPTTSPPPTKTSPPPTKEATKPDLPPRKKDFTKRFSTISLGSRSVSSPAISSRGHNTKKLNLHGSLAPRLHRENMLSMFAINTESQRNKVIKEIIYTEADFIDDCDIIINIYLASVQKSNVLPESVVDEIFTNILEIRYANLEFLQELMRVIPSLETNPNQCPNIGGIFATIPTRFQLYETYLSRHDHSMKILKEHQQRKEVAEVLSMCAAHPETGRLNLESFLIKPIQRICKYPLLLRELKKSLPPHDPQVFVCEGAILELESFIGAVNDKIKTTEKMEQIKKHLGKNEFISLVLEGRSIVKEGRLRRVKGGSLKDKYFWLLDNCLLWCKIQKKMSILPQKMRKTNKRMIPIINISSVESADVLPHSFGFSIVYNDDKNKRRVLVLSAESYLEKLLWIHTLERFL